MRVLKRERHATGLPWRRAAAALLFFLKARIPVEGLLFGEEGPRYIFFHELPKGLNDDSSKTIVEPRDEKHAPHATILKHMRKIDLKH